MKKALLLLLGLFFAIGSYASDMPTFIGGCFSQTPDGTSISFSTSYLGPGVPAIYIWIPTPTGIQGPFTSDATYGDQSTFSGWTFNLGQYGITLTGCTTITYTDDPVSQEMYTATLCPCIEPPASGACYFIDNYGSAVVKLVSPNANIYNWVVWVPDASGNYYPSPNYVTENTNGTLDPDGVNYDYYFSNSMVLPDKNGCGTVYYSSVIGDGNGNYDPTVGTWASSINACPCPLTTVGQCFDDDGHGNLVIHLTAPVSTTLFLWAQSGSTATAYGASGSPVLDATGNFQYTFSIPESSLPGGFYTHGQTDCLSFYIATTTTANAAGDDADPKDFATQIRVCPCCSQTSQRYMTYTLNTQAANPLTVNFPTGLPTFFDFGDGSPQVYGSNGSHTYASAGSYSVTATTANQPDLPACTKSDVICLTGIAADKSYINNRTDPNNQCNTDFTATINGNSVTITPNTLTLHEANWGDGTASSFFTTGITSITHIYSATGNYVLCLETLGWCQTCMSICIDEDEHNAQRQAPPQAPIPATVQQLVTGIDIYPNPASDVATLSFSLQNDAIVKIDVVDIVGRVVAPVANTSMAAGNQKIEVSTASLPSGIYNVNIQTDKGTTTKRLSVIK